MTHREDRGVMGMTRRTGRDEAYTRLERGFPEFEQQPHITFIDAWANGNRARKVRALPLELLPTLDVRRLLPARIPHLAQNQPNRPARVWCATTSRHVSVESYAEQKTVIRLDWMTQVRWIVGQGFYIHVWFDGVRWTHCPDLVVLTDDGLRVIEVRPEGRRTRRFEEQRLQTAAILAELGLAYDLYSRWNAIEWLNLDWIAAYRRPLVEGSITAAEILDVVALGPIALDDLVQCVAPGPYDRSDALPLIFKLLWTQHLRTDLRRLLDTASVLTLGPSYGTPVQHLLHRGERPDLIDVMR